LPVSAHECGIFEAIEPGDSLSEISQRCDIPIDDLYLYNPEIDALDLPIGTALNLAPPAPQLPEGMSPQVAYETLTGFYAHNGICLGQEVIVELNSTSVSFGETRCTISQVHAIHGTFVIHTSGCQSEGEQSPAQVIQISPLEDGSISYGSDGEFTLDLCSDI